MKLKKVYVIVIICIGAFGIGAYIAIPNIAEHLIRGKLTEQSGNSVKDIHVSWSGPQIISGLHVEDTFGFVDVEIKIPSSLISLLGDNEYIFGVRGSATIHALQTDTSQTDRLTEEKVSTNPVSSTSKSKASVFSIPHLTATVILETLTISGVEPLSYHDVQGSITIDPGRVFSFNVSAVTDTDGSITCFGDAPDLLTKQGDLNWDASASLGVTIQNAMIPTINGQGGWSIVELAGDISSPNLSEAIVVSMSGKFSQYDIPKGLVIIKTQLLTAPNSQGAFVYKGKEIVGTIDVHGVPTSILSPFINKYGVDASRDIGKTMEFHLARSTKDSLLTATFNSDQISASGIVDSINGIISEIDITANIGDELIQHVSHDELAGRATINLRLEQLVPIGSSVNDNSECFGAVDIVGSLQHVPTLTNITSFTSNFSADLKSRALTASGSSVLNGVRTTFDASLLSSNKNKLDGIDALWTTITSQLPRGNGTVSVEHIPTSLLHAYIPDEEQKYIAILGDTFSLRTDLAQNELHAAISSNKTTINGGLVLVGDAIHSIQNLKATLHIPPKLLTTLLGSTISNNATLIAEIEKLDFEGNATFTASYEIGAEHTYVQGETSRQVEGERAGELDARLTLTGIDARLLDAIWNCNRILADSLGSPVAVEIVGTDILKKLTVHAIGTSPHSSFETSLGISSGIVYTLQNTSTRGDLQLSEQLTQHLLKDLGPVLSDIRSVTHPIQMTISNASTNIHEDVSSLNADIHINIGEVALDSGSATMKLLPMFNTKHVEFIPAFFDPIHIEIRRGVATYKKFHLTLANKYSIPYSGAIDFTTRKLNIKTAIPLTGLGYSIKELRGLVADIDVPILITGTIDHPITKVDPQFDLSELLQSAAVTTIGDAIGDVFGGDNDAPNPLDLLEELLGGR